MATQKKSLSSYLKEIHEKMYREFVNNIMIDYDVSRKEVIKMVRYVRKLNREGKIIWKKKD